MRAHRQPVIQLLASPVLARDIEDMGLARRLQWLLVFRAAVATFLLVLALAADVAAWPVQLMSIVVYGVVVGTYLVVFVLGMLLRAQVSPVVISAIHLATAVMGSLMAVQGTGGVESGLSFLYLLVILDAAIIGARPVALVTASACSVAYGGQLALQLYGVFSAGLPELPSPFRFTSAAVVHVAAFFLIALLGGQIARLLQSAEEEVSSARIDLRVAEAFNRAVLESLPVGVLTLDASRIVRSVNLAASRILDSSTGGLIGRPPPDFLRPFFDSTQAAAELELELDGRRRVLAMVRSSMHLQEAEASAEPLDVVVLEDRTEVRALEESLRASERLATIGEMAAAFAHELRNPLAAISGSVEMLRERDYDDADRVRLESIVLREIERLDALVTDVLEYARPSPPQRVRVDVAGLVRDLVEFLRADAAWRENELRLESPARLEAVLDGGQVRQMLWNLLRNAVEASPTDAPVELAVSEAKANGGRAVCICVRDHGPGMPESERAAAFEPFRTTKAKGTGLGLAVVSRIVEAHEGTVELTGAPGGGALARVVLPAELP
jgi:two-component system sensor histidine kinase PilS (NtrC family)